MKTRVIILSAAFSVLLISCKTDRSQDEEIQTSPVSKVELKKLKIDNREEGTSKIEDSIIVSPPKTQSTSGEGFEPQIPESEGGDPKDVPPRK